MDPSVSCQESALAAAVVTGSSGIVWAALAAIGARDWALDEAATRLALGEAALSGAGLPPNVCAELVALGHFIVDREV